MPESFTLRKLRTITANNVETIAPSGFESIINYYYHGELVIAMDERVNIKKTHNPMEMRDGTIFR